MEQDLNEDRIKNLVRDVLRRRHPAEIEKKDPVVVLKKPSRPLIKTVNRLPFEYVKGRSQQEKKMNEQFVNICNFRNRMMKKKSEMSRDEETLKSRIGKKTNIEIEARFGTTFRDRREISPDLNFLDDNQTAEDVELSFKSELENKLYLNNLIHYLDSGDFDVTETIDEVTSLKGTNLRMIHNLNTGEKFVERKEKSKKDTVTDFQYQVRVSSALEIPGTSEDYVKFGLIQNSKTPLPLEDIRGDITLEDVKKSILGDSVPTTGDIGIKQSISRNGEIYHSDVRTRKRKRYISTNRKSMFFNYYIDITTVIHKGKTSQQVELEIKETVTYTDPKEFMNVIEVVLKIMQGQTERVLNYNYIQNLAGIHNSLFTGKEPKMNSTFTMRYRNKPVNLTLSALKDKVSNYLTTIKVDGTRCSLMYVRQGLFMIVPPNGIIKIGDFDKGEDLKKEDPSGYQKNLPRPGYLFDCEAMNEMADDGTEKTALYIFDVMVLPIVPSSRDDVKDPFDKKTPLSISNVMDKDFSGRFSAVQTFVDLYRGLYDNYVLKKKKYYSTGSIYDSLKKAWDVVTADEELLDASDGLILQSPGKYSDVNYKWKPADKMSIDFVLKITKYEDEYIPCVIASNGKIVPFTGSKKHKFKGTVKRGPFFDEVSRASVYECIYNYQEETFYILRERWDRAKPNGQVPAANVWDDIIRPIPVDVLTGSNLKIMRKIHNKFKFDMLNRFLKKGDTILDMGSGRGGDLDKWKHLKLKRVYVIEPDEDVLETFNERKQRMKTTVDIVEINTGGQNHEVISNTLDEHNDSGNIDAVVMFYSLTFFNKISLKMLLKTFKSIKYGGYIFGIVLDGDRVKKLPFDTKNKYTAPSFTIEKKGRSKIITNIIEEDSMVKDVEEYLFSTFDFIEMMENAGFEKVDGLDDKIKNDQVNQLPSHAKTFSDLNYVFAFQKPFPKIEQKKIIEVLSFGNEDDIELPIGKNFSYVGLPLNDSLTHSYILSKSPSDIKNSIENNIVEFKKIFDHIDMKKITYKKEIEDYYIKLFGENDTSKLEMLIRLTLAEDVWTIETTIPILTEIFGHIPLVYETVNGKFGGTMSIVPHRKLYSSYPPARIIRKKPNISYFIILVIDDEFIHLVKNRDSKKYTFDYKSPIVERFFKNF